MLLPGVKYLKDDVITSNSRESGSPIGLIHQCRRCVSSYLLPGATSPKHFKRRNFNRRFVQPVTTAFRTDLNLSIRLYGWAIKSTFCKLVISCKGLLPRHGMAVRCTFGRAICVSAYGAACQHIYESLIAPPPRDGSSGHRAPLTPPPPPLSAAHPTGVVPRNSIIVRLPSRFT